MSERFYILEHEGYPIDDASGKITSSRDRSGSQGALTEVMVLDRAYCHRVVWSCWSSLPIRADKNTRRKRSRKTSVIYRKQLAEAQAICARLNEENA